LKSESGYPKDAGVAFHRSNPLQTLGPRFLTGILTWSVGRGISDGNWHSSPHSGACQLCLLLHNCSNTLFSACICALNGRCVVEIKICVLLLCVGEKFVRERAVDIGVWYVFCFGFFASLRLAIFMSQRCVLVCVHVFSNECGWIYEVAYACECACAGAYMCAAVSCAAVWGKRVLVRVIVVCTHACLRGGVRVHVRV